MASYGKETSNELSSVIVQRSSIPLTSILKIKTASQACRRYQSE
jgi:hypothetical protein